MTLAGANGGHLRTSFHHGPFLLARVFSIFQTNPDAKSLDNVAVICLQKIEVVLTRISVADPILEKGLAQV